jgi:hypothetical protein
MTTRIDETLELLRTDYPILRLMISNKAQMPSKKTVIEAGISLGGGWRGPGFMRSSNKTKLRKLIRAVMLCSFVLETKAFAASKTQWESSTDAQLCAELKRLEKGLPVVAASGSRPMQTGSVDAGGKRKHYNWLKQATHTDGAIENESLARARGYVPQTMRGIETGLYVAEDGGDSCGPTCIAMAHYYITDTQLSEQTAREDAMRKPDGYHATGAGSGTFESALASVMNDLGHGFPAGWRNGYFAPNSDNFLKIARSVTKRKPVIFNVGWHFSLAVEVIGDDLVCVDPWFGPTVVNLKALPVYPQSGKAFNGYLVYLS